jgi:peptidoglycan/LPS O-acetylase OafA/YrhL
VKTIIPIQVLRALAATAVVAEHFQFDLSRRVGAPAPHPELWLGGAGVDLFFVISGFVMVYASEPLFARSGAALTFFSHRVVRIVPLYWLATATYLLMAAAVPALAKGYTFDWVLTSLFFIPYPRPDGVMQPVVGQGWTLNYEMFFYLIFTLAVLVRRTAAVAFASLVLGGVVLAGLVVAPSRPALAYLSDPIVLEFTLGMLLALAYRSRLRLPRPVSWALMLAGPVLLVTMTHFVSADPALRLFIWGMPMALVVAGATLGDFDLTAAAWRLLARLGDASYALYLFHSFAVRAVVYFVIWAKFDIAKMYWPLLAAAVAGAIVMAILIHYIFERPVTQALRGAVAAVGISIAAPARAQTGEVSSR